MITLFNLTGPWWAWVLICSPVAVAVAVLITLWRRGRPEWCDDCQEWCGRDYVCDCCYAAAAEPVDQADDDARTLAARAGSMHLWLLDHLRRQSAAAAAPPPAPPNAMAFALALPELVDIARAAADPRPGPFESELSDEQRAAVDELELEPGDDWADTLTRINAELKRAGADPLDRLEADTLTDDPDVLEWDARQQAAAAWEIINVRFPNLRTRIDQQYAAAAAELAGYWQAAA